MSWFNWTSGLGLFLENNINGSAIRCVKIDTTYADSCQANFNIVKNIYPNASGSTYPNITNASSIAGSDNLDKVEVKISKNSISIFDSIVSYGYGRSYDVNSPDTYDDIFQDGILPAGKYDLTIQINLETSLGCKDTVVYTYNNSWNDTTCSASHTSWLLYSSGTHFESVYTKAYNDYLYNGGPYTGIIDSIGFYTLAVHNPFHQNTGTSGNILEETHILSKNNNIINNITLGYSGDMQALNDTNGVPTILGLDSLYSYKLQYITDAGCIATDSFKFKIPKPNDCSAMGTYGGGWVQIDNISDGRTSITIGDNDAYAHNNIPGVMLNENGDILLEGIHLGNEFTSNYIGDYTIDDGLYDEDDQNFGLELNLFSTEGDTFYNYTYRAGDSNPHGSENYIDTSLPSGRYIYETKVLTKNGCADTFRMDTIHLGIDTTCSIELQKIMLVLTNQVFILIIIVLYPLRLILLAPILLIMYLILRMQ